LKFFTIVFSILFENFNPVLEKCKKYKNYYIPLRSWVMLIRKYNYSHINNNVSVDLQKMSAVPLFFLSLSFQCSYFSVQEQFKFFLEFIIIQKMNGLYFQF
jgi:hypothetical protein